MPVTNKQKVKLLKLLRQESDEDHHRCDPGCGLYYRREDKGPGGEGLPAGWYQAKGDHCDHYRQVQQPEAYERRDLRERRYAGACADQ